MKPLGIRVVKRKDETIYLVDIQIYSRVTSEAEDVQRITINDNNENKAIAQLEENIAQKRSFLNSLKQLGEGYHREEDLPDDIELPAQIIQG